MEDFEPKKLVEIIARAKGKHHEEQVKLEMESSTLPVLSEGSLLDEALPELCEFYDVPVEYIKAELTRHRLSQADQRLHLDQHGVEVDNYTKGTHVLNYFAELYGNMMVDCLSKTYESKFRVERKETHLTRVTSIDYAQPNGINVDTTVYVDRGILSLWDRFVTMFAGQRKDALAKVRLNANNTRTEFKINVFLYDPRVIAACGDKFKEYHEHAKEYITKLGLRYSEYHYEIKAQYFVPPSLTASQEQSL